MGYYFWDNVKTGTIVVGFVVGLLLMANWYEQYQCGNFQETTGKETKYHALDTCYVKADAGWQRWDEYKMRATASEGLKGD